MAYSLKIVDLSQNLQFNVKYENLTKLKRPHIEVKTIDNINVQEKTIYQNQILERGSTQKKYVDIDGNAYSKQSLKFYHKGEEVRENIQTKVLNIDGYQPESAYTDQYIIANYYELYPSSDNMKNDSDKETARIFNLCGMKKLWEHLYNNKLVARGEMCISSRGFVASDGYLRAIQFGNHWGLELGIFRECKVFEHLQEKNNNIVQIPQIQQAKRLKMV